MVKKLISVIEGFQQSVTYSEGNGLIANFNYYNINKPVKRTKVKSRLSQGVLDMLN